MNTKLKHILVDHNEPAWKVAHKMNRPDSWISKVTSGMIVPNSQDQVDLAKILGVKVDAIFGEEVR